MNDDLTVHFERVNKYRFRLAKDFVFYQNRIVPEEMVSHQYFALLPDGRLKIEAGYAWDGASGIVLSQESVLRASLVHDVCYQMMRLGLIDQSNRKAADKLFYDLSIYDQVPVWVAKIYYSVLRAFGAPFAAKGSEKPCKVEVI